MCLALEACILQLRDLARGLDVASSIGVSPDVQSFTHSITVEAIGGCLDYSAAQKKMPEIFTAYRGDPNNARPIA